MSRWLMRSAAHPGPALRLFCFPYAGIGASAFRLWPAGLPPGVELATIQLPGREARLREPPIPDIPVIVDQLLPVLADNLDVPFVFFGHSMGAVVAWAVARALHERGHGTPSHVILSGRRPPRIADPEAPLRHLSDDDFVSEINLRYGGIPAQVLDDRELLALLLPALRADIAALETYRQGAVEPLDCPLTVFGGVEDIRAPISQLDFWREETTAEFQLRKFPGGHFFINTARPAVLTEVGRILASLLAGEHRIQPAPALSARS